MSETLSFWARRRAAVQAEEQAEALAARAAEDAARDAELAERDDAEVLAELGLPDPAGMKAGDDFTGFLSRDVPEHLRRQALRTLWRSNPVLACVDGLNEYDDDYRAAMLLQEPIKTAYQVGKGMMKHVEEMERKAALADAPQEAAEQDGEDAQDVAEAPHVQAATEEQVAEATGAHEAAAADVAEANGPQHIDAEPEGTEAPAPRRMRFHFEGAAV